MSLSLLDMVAATAAAAASAALGLRFNMLKPGFNSWCSAPGRVLICLLMLSVVCGVSALSIIRGGGHATAREALVMIVLALTAVVMLDNLHRQSPAAQSSADAEPID